ncbi:MAG: ankyrin repeat domain-containing protein, partial [Phycisphaerales bacterium]|nr:ankyrin repeat domain-containing protein [Phycisphaerales bacterium]
MRQNKEAVRSLLRQKVDVNMPQADGATALHWAVYWDDLETADLLIAAGANAKTSNREGATPLALACMNGNAAMIEKLLKGGADVNVPVMANGETALMMASRSGNVAAIKMLLNNGANVSATEPLRGTTALMWAVEQEHPAAVQSLIAGGADINAKSKTIVRAARRGRPSADDGEFGGPTGTTGGLTPLVYAARQGDLASAGILVEAGADVNLKAADGSTPMLVATHNKFNLIASYLLDRGADPNIANAKGWTPLYIATDNRNLEFGTMPVRNADMDHLDWIKKLLAAGANPNARAGADTEHRTGFNT